MSAAGRELLLPIKGTLKDAREDQGRIIEGARERIRSAARERVGEADLAAVEMLDAASANEQLKLREMLYHLGRFIVEYGEPGLWKALWCRFALHESLAWSVAQDYQEGDELRAIYGRYWKQALATSTAQPNDLASEVAAVDVDLADVQYDITQLENRLVVLERERREPA